VFVRVVSGKNLNCSLPVNFLSITSHLPAVIFGLTLRKQFMALTGLPNKVFDVVHIACTSHLTRLQNVQRAPGINMKEKAILHQRSANYPAIP
jgi:hypothetical protein